MDEDFWTTADQEALRKKELRRRIRERGEGDLVKSVS
jgi:hypothetical protein